MQQNNMERIQNNSQYGWRTIEVLAGIISVMLSLVVIAQPGIALATLAVLFPVVLIAIGIVRVANGVRTYQVAEKTLGAGAIVAGVIAMLLALFLFAVPPLAFATLAYTLMFGLFILGIERVLAGLTVQDRSGWYRTMVMAVGLASLALAFAILIMPGLGAATLITLFAAVLAANGVENIATGIAGIPRKFAVAV